MKHFIILAVGLFAVFSEGWNAIFLERHFPLIIRFFQQLKHLTAMFAMIVPTSMETIWLNLAPKQMA